jgi:1,4-dihydroxy-2-naphthoate octaprenyltransferase
MWKSRLKTFVSIVEIKTKTISIVTFGSAVLYSVYRSGELDLPLFILMTLAVLFVDMGTTAFNNYFDYRSGVDVPEYSKDRDKILMLGNISAFTALHIALVLFLLAGITGLVIAFMTSLWVAVAGAASMAVGYLYNGGPRPISRTPFGEIFAGGFLGSVLFLITFYVLAGGLSLAAFIVSLPTAFLVGSILLVNNTCDMVGDRRAGRKTFAILAGGQVAELFVYIGGAAAYGLLLLSVYRGLLPQTVWYTAAPAILVTIVRYVRMHRRGYNHDTKVVNMKSIVAIYLLYGIQLIVALLIVTLY